MNIIKFKLLLGKKKKGVLGMFLIYLILSFLLIFLFGFGIPFLIHFTTDLYNIGGDIIESVNTSNLPNTTQEAINMSINSISTQTEILSFFFQYGWVIFLIIILFILFIRSRTLVESELIR